MLNIKSEESFKEANKKTTACALMNLEDYSISSPRENALVSEQEMKNCLYGDIPKEFRTKQTSKKIYEKDDMKK